MSQIKVNALVSYSGNTVTLGTSGDTINVASNVTFNTSSNVVLPAGDVGTPSLTTQGDTNTGIFFPAADTIAFTEGGTESMRIDSSANLKFNSGFGSVATAYGCRAWVNFDGTGTVAIRGSGNVTSITDNGTGNYTVNFTTAMPDANYATVICAKRNATNNFIAYSIYQGGTYSTTAVQIATWGEAAYAAEDPVIVNVLIFR